MPAFILGDVIRPTEAISALGAEELEAFREVAQPAVTALIAERFGEEGTAMLEQMLAALEE